MLFVAFFPQIISGPISKAQSLIPQIKTTRSFDYDKAVEGLRMLLWGMVLKTVMADRLGLYVDTVYSQYEYYSGSTLLLTSICYSLQIYGDFAGYSLMAIGVGKLLGFDLPENFRRPYFAVSVTQFWRRWHISLTRWLTDYVYIPLGGSRCSKLKCYRNILATFLVSGIWHGANWTFIFWGFIHGVAQVVEKTVGLGKRDSKNRLEKWVRIFITFMVVNLAWIFFRMPTIQDAWYVITKIFSNLNGALYIDKTAFFYMGIAIIVVAMKDVADEFFENKHMILDSHYKAVRWLGYIALVMLLLLCGVFDAGQFIYANF